MRTSTAPDTSGRAVGTSRILADAHVHIYSCFALARFFDAAWTNFSREAAGGPFTGVLLLAETAEDDWFAALGVRADAGESVDGQAATPWRPQRTGEAESLRIAGPESESLLLIAGRQLVTRERLEVLALGTAARFDDGLPLSQAVDQVRAAGAVPVLPWGFGKWWGRRGAVLRAYLETVAAGALFVGDNGSRPQFAPTPAPFRQAAARGVRMLPGTDPLPLAAECTRVGSYGFYVRASLDPEHPARSVRAALQASGVAPVAYGARKTPPLFVWRQAALQFRQAGRAT